MTPQQLLEIQKTITDTIETVVNGKIRRLDEKLDAYIVISKEWRDSVDPSIEIIQKMQSFWSVSGWVFKTTILIGSASAAIWALFKFIIKDN